jgi:cytochrome c oxidase assembly protein subunit 15
MLKKNVLLQKKNMSRKSLVGNYPKIITLWLGLGLIMIFFQVVIGGITRLTGSGLSITKWEIVTGTLPPMDEATWEVAFEEYKETPQYKKINEGMEMKDFKFIYFWEYFHRLWARTMGFVFILPFLYFLRKGWIDSFLLKRLGIVVVLAATVASFGWIMVASGLVERPWVNAYKLTLHLSLALILFSYLLWTFLLTFKRFPHVTNILNIKLWTKCLLFILAFQIILGGIVSGSKAALFYPTWPDMNGQYIPDVMVEKGSFNIDNFIHYDKNPYFSAWIQFLHRNVAYILTFSILYFIIFYWKKVDNASYKRWLVVLASLLVTQVLLGIFTLKNSIYQIPVNLGVAHQAVALLLLTTMLIMLFSAQTKKI